MRWTWVICALAASACGDDGSAVKTDAAVDEATIDAMVDAADTRPRTLAESGLCVDAGCSQIAADVYAYAPRFELYSDTATKRRWIYLPPGTKIDTTDMDHWSFPVGTKLWKEFTRGSTRVETRLIMRTGTGNTMQDWYYAAFVWNQAQDATTLAEFGQVDANGTQHDVPSRTLCRECHENNKPSRVLGFSAIQLAFTGATGEIDLADAIANNWLTTAPSGAAPAYGFDVPGNTTEKAALGYLHANCGHCHNPNSAVFSNRPVQFRLTVGTLGTLAGTPTYTTAVNVMATTDTKDIVEPQMPNQSHMIERFESTNPAQRMPAVGVELTDTAGQTILRDWITNMP